MIKSNDVRETAYKLYQLDWMMRHSFGLVDFVDSLARTASKCWDEYEDPVPIPLAERFLNWEKYLGFDHKLYDSFEVFLEEEYQDRHYMEPLFRNLPDAPELKAAYRADLKRLEGERVAAICAPLDGDSVQPKEEEEDTDD